MTVSLGILFVPLVYMGWRWYARHRLLSGIPTIGYSVPILSWVSAMRYVINAREMVQEGYKKFKPGVFKIANIDGWVVVVAGRQYLDEVRKLPDDVLSFAAAVEERHQVKYTLGEGVGPHDYHAEILRSCVSTRNLATLFDGIHDETQVAFNDLLPTTCDGECTKVRVKPMLQSLIGRMSNRVFIGLPLCRNEDWIKLNIDFTINAVIGAQVLRVFPECLKPLAARLFTKVSSLHRRGFALAQPVIEARLRMTREDDHAGGHRPNDFLQRLMDSEESRDRSPQDFCKRVLAANFGAIHTTQMSLTQALYHLAAHPLWQRELCTEVQALVQAHGWSKDSLAMMPKLDSFLREQQRHNGLSVLTVTRLALQSFTFSNGVHVPKGTFVECALFDTHHDRQNYTDPDVFDPWRFYSMCGVEGQSTKHQLVTTSTEFLTFGLGRQACPGRFLAAIMLKLVIAHIVLDYELCFEDGATGYPPDTYLNGYCLPADKEVVFRRKGAVL